MRRVIIAFALYPISIVNGKNIVVLRITAAPTISRLSLQTNCSTHKLELIIPSQRIVVDTVAVGKLYFYIPGTFAKVQMRFSKVLGSFIENVNEGRTFITHDRYLTSTLPNKIDISNCVTEIVSVFVALTFHNIDISFRCSLFFFANISVWNLELVFLHK